MKFQDLPDHTKFKFKFDGEHTSFLYQKVPILYCDYEVPVTAYLCLQDFCKKCPYIVYSTAEFLNEKELVVV